MVRTAALAIAVIASSPSQAATEKWQIDTGNVFLSTCGETRNTRTVDHVDFGMCYGWLGGFLAFHRSISRSLFCYPSHVTNNQLMDVILVGIERDPATRHYPTAVLAAGALMKAFPCPAEGK